MKKPLLVVISTLAVLFAVTATADRKVWMYSHSGNHLSMDVSDFDSLSFETPAILELSEYNKKLDSKGGSFNLGITTNQAWKAEVNNPIAVTLSKTMGTGSDEITVTAMENTGTKSYSFIVTVTAQNGTYKQLIGVVAGTEESYLKLDPEMKNLASTGGRFSLDITTDQAWTAEVSDPSALTISKTSGSGKATINVGAISNADTKPYTEYVTVELEDGIKGRLTVNVSVTGEYVSSDIGKGITIEKKGGSFESNVSSNTFWSVESNQSWLTVSPTSGKYNGKINVSVEANPNGDDEYAILTFKAIGGYSSAVSVIREGDRISVGPKSKTFAPAGGTYKIGVQSNTDWTVSANEPWVTFDKTEGTLSDSIEVTVGKADKDAASATITVTTTYGKTATCTVTHEADNVSVSPMSKTLPPLGDTYKIGVESNTDWTVSASEPWVSFDRTSGSLNDSIVVTVGKGDKDAASATITVTTTYGKAAECNIQHERDYAYIEMREESSRFPLSGGVHKVPVVSNTDWTVIASDSWVTVDKTSGTLNDSIVVTVAKSESAEATETVLTIRTNNGCSSYAHVERYDYVYTSDIIYSSYAGGSFDNYVYSNTEWTASSDKEWVTLSDYSGTGDISNTQVIIAANKSKADTAIVTYSTPYGITAKLMVCRDGYTCKGDNITDINGKSYPTIWINGQNWMAENYACRKYDTKAVEVMEKESDWSAYKDKSGNIVIPKAKPSTTTFKDTIRTPYYTDATDRNTWSQRTAAKKQQTSLSEEQVAKMGYLYNWAAAVGVNEDLLRTTDFTGKRQGICPNGWHVPSQSELDALKSYIEGAKGTDTAGSHLKSTSGWYNAGNPSKYPQGVDTYGFDLLPAGFSAGDSISNVGAAGHVLTSKPSATRETKFYYGYGSYTNSKFTTSDGAPRCNGRSLRCIKDND